MPCLGTPQRNEIDERVKLGWTDSLIQQISSQQDRNIQAYVRDGKKSLKAFQI